MTDPHAKIPTDEEMGWPNDPTPTDEQMKWGDHAEHGLKAVWNPTVRWSRKKAKAVVQWSRGLLSRISFRRKADRPNVHDHEASTTTPASNDRSLDLPPDPYPPTSTDISQIIGVPYTLVDSTSSIAAMLDALEASISASDTLLAGMDIEGFELGKPEGETYLLQIYDHPSHHLYMVDISTLGRTAFTTTSSDGTMTLKIFLESADLQKLFCDVRADSYALFKEFGICLQGIKDVQLMQIASRRYPSNRQRRSGLAHLIDRYAELSNEEKKSVRQHKHHGQHICRTWGYALFSHRPLRGDLTVYAANDVRYLPKIYDKLLSEMSQERIRTAEVETQKAILATQSPDYNPDQSREQMVAANWHYQYEDDYVETDEDYL